MQRIICSAFLLSLVFSINLPAQTQQPAVSVGKGGKLFYQPDAKGNRIPDFSHCGYMGQDESIRDIPVRIVVSPTTGDNTQRIQAALDYVASLTADENGIRGAVLLLKGRYELYGGLKMSASGVVLRGQGPGKEGSVLVAAGTNRRTLIRVIGKNDQASRSESAYQIVDDYVPVGAYSFKLNSTEGLKVGDMINIIRPSTKEWIKQLGMDRFGGDFSGAPAWRPGSYDLVWDRVIKSIDADHVEVDAPITTAIEAQFGSGLVQLYSWPGRISHVGVENLRCESAYDPENPKDEAHSWMAVTMENVENAWVRQVTMEHFAGSAVAIYESCKQITVQDCMSLSPVSEYGGYRRHTFFTMGQLTLFLHCWAEHGRHDFAAGFCAAGPNAFVQCESTLPMEDSGPIESWSSGTLYDNVNIDGNALRLCNRGSRGQGLGWAAANSVLWQCNAAVIQCENPPTAQNWAFGCWGEFEGDGIWDSSNNFVRPTSLFEAQIAERLGPEAARRLALRPLSTESSTNPGIQGAEEFTIASRQPQQQLWQYIAEASVRHKIPTESGGAKTLEDVLAERNIAPSITSKQGTEKKLSLINGWLTIENRLLIGSSGDVAWWRGKILPREARSVGSCLTRFMPGRIGPGYTDDLNELTDEMVSKGQAVLNHNYGLWYDRRRDDHERIRRMNGDTRPPYYELPFARGGQGTAWDGLSKYDLTKYNPWYWGRLKEFATLCEQKGLVLLHHNYFQHNILEAGAHWADFPWRSANNINDTGFPEPPPYAGNKRIFMDELFYDVNHPVRRALHRLYIHKCLENFSDNSSVIQLTSAEFTGPLEFVRFWLDTIIEWKQETGRKPLIALSCTKDVQDAILADPVRSRAVSVIDIRYWWYQANGELYAPEGGLHLAPRQFERIYKPGPSSFDQVFHAVREYSNKFPDKAILYSANNANGWAVLMGGGSIPNLPATTDKNLLAALSRMKPINLPDEVAGQYALAEPGESYLVYASSGQTIQLDLTNVKGYFEAHWLNPRNGSIVSGGDKVAGGEKVELAPVFNPCVLWLKKQ
jgi:hypothetical protein